MGYCICIASSVRKKNYPSKGKWEDICLPNQVWVKENQIMKVSHMKIRWIPTQNTLLHIILIKKDVFT